MPFYGSSKLLLWGKTREEAVSRMRRLLFAYKITGIKSRLENLQAAVLKIKLPHIHKWNNKRAKNAEYYNKILQGIGDVIILRETEIKEC